MGLFTFAKKYYPYRIKIIRHKYSQKTKPKAPFPIRWINLYLLPIIAGNSAYSVFLMSSSNVQSSLFVINGVSFIKGRNRRIFKEWRMLFVKQKNNYI